MSSEQQKSQEVGLATLIEANKAKIKSQMEATSAKLDINYQKGVLHLCWKDEAVLARVYFAFKRLKISTSIKNSSTNDIAFFISTELSIIWAAMYHFACEEMFTIDEGSLKQWINDHYSATEADNAKRVFDQIKKLDIPEPQVYKDHLQAYLEMMTVLNVFVISSELFAKKDYKSVNEIWAIGVDEFNGISLGQKSYKTLSSVFDYLADDNVQTFPTGIPLIDEELSGGFSRGGLHLIVAGSNIGKTAFSVERARVWASMGYKVVYYALDSAKNEVSRRAAANAAKVPLKSITRKTLTPEEMIRVKRAVEEINENNLRINENFAYPDTVEDVCLDINRVCKEWEPDIVIVDYLEKLGTSKFFPKKSEMLGHIANVLKSCAAKNNIGLVSPAQGTREAQKVLNGSSNSRINPDEFVMNLTDVGNSQELSNVAASIISIVATEEEMKKGLRRVALVKTREGESRIVVGVRTALHVSQFITGDFYDPRQVSMDLSTREAPNGSVKVIRNNPTSSIEARERLIKLDDDINQVRHNLKQSEEILKALDRHDSRYGIETMNKDQLKEKLNPLMSEAKDIARVLYPNVSKDLIEQMAKSNKDLKNASKTHDEIEHYKKTLLETRLMAYAVVGGSKLAIQEPFNPPAIKIEQPELPPEPPKEEVKVEPAPAVEEPPQADSVNPIIDF